jgi:hypothetical protein
VDFQHLALFCLASNGLTVNISSPKSVSDYEHSLPCIKRDTRSNTPKPRTSSVTTQIPPERRTSYVITVYLEPPLLSVPRLSTVPPLATVLQTCRYRLWIVIKLNSRFCRLLLHPHCTTSIHDDKKFLCDSILTDDIY